ncbi:hypothetical protein KY49_6881 [Burkholderia sp. MSHR3999]|uniref:hypothetical protein n=1 Tax=Burkholderia sp. MSHR3999 TaxID=1542965 RepID=UPI0005B74578|nr:hypothetical protein [Burkholderia sp. MSHR3999]KIP17080.1 hypothetical protein KY49_6881 [Burkholderia sp. MSHR3999]
METKKCLENIAKRPFPVPCRDEFCAEIRGDINEYCKHAGLAANTPVPAQSAAGRCWCCCGGVFADATAAAISGQAFQPLVELRAGDRVLATGPDLVRWEQADVKAIGRLQAMREDTGAVQLDVALPDGKTVTLRLATEALLLGDDALLHAAGQLTVGAKLRTVDSKLAEVTASRTIQANVAHIHLGRVDPAAPLHGHLFNLAGLVCADLAVSVAAFLGELPDGLFAPRRPH